MRYSHASRGRLTPAHRDQNHLAGPSPVPGVYEWSVSRESQHARALKPGGRPCVLLALPRWRGASEIRVTKGGDARIAQPRLLNGARGPRALPDMGTSPSHAQPRRKSATTLNATQATEKKLGGRQQQVPLAPCQVKPWPGATTQCKRGKKARCERQRQNQRHVSFAARGVFPRSDAHQPAAGAGPGMPAGPHACRPGDWQLTRWSRWPVQHMPWQHARAGAAVTPGPAVCTPWVGPAGRPVVGSARHRVGMMSQGTLVAARR